MPNTEWLGEAKLKSSELPQITTSQQDILLLLYRYRFLKSSHIQALLGGRSKALVNARIKDLKDKNYVLNLKRLEKGYIKPLPVYFVGKNGIRALRARSDTTDIVLRRLVRNGSVSRELIDRKLKAADIAVERFPESEVATSSSIANRRSSAYWLYEMGLSPDLIARSKAGLVYLVEVITPSIPAYAIRRLVRLYLEAINATDWDLKILMVCDNRAQTGVIYRAIRKTTEPYSWQIEITNEY